MKSSGIENIQAQCVAQQKMAKSSYFLQSVFQDVLIQNPLIEQRQKRQQAEKIVLYVQLFQVTNWGICQYNKVLFLQQLAAVRNKQSPRSFPTITLESVDLLHIKSFMYTGCLYFCMSHLKKHQHRIMFITKC